MKKIFFSVFLLGLMFTSSALAADTATSSITSAYREYQEVSIPKILVPTVVSVPLMETNLERFDFLVTNKNNNKPEPSLLLIYKSRTPLYFSIIDLNSNRVVNNSEAISDYNESTSVELPIIDDKPGAVEITIKSDKEISTDSIFLLLDNYVALPNTISILAGSEGDLKTVLATKKVDSQSIYFPKTTASKFVIKLTYSQPLRITELRLGGFAYEGKSYQLRFLAQPNNQYRIYFNPDRKVYIPTGEMGNLADNNGVLNLGNGTSISNPAFIISDSDADGIPDVRDNCVSVKNPNQEDINSNGRGDVCDDFDKDGVINNLDNCPDLPNYNQQDTDADKIGDVCDGVESRITEQYKWLPWVGIGLAGIIVIGLFIFTAMSMRKKPETEINTDINSNNL